MQREEEKMDKKINGNGVKVGIVVAEFNWDVTGKMLDGAVDFLSGSGVLTDDIGIVKVPGSFEIPLACKRMIDSGKFDTLIALGCIIKGGTKHDFYLAQAVFRGVMSITVDTGVPVGFGVITTDNLEQAQERSSEKCNKGIEAAQAALMMANKLKTI